MNSREPSSGRCVALVLLDPLQVGLKAGGATPQDPLGVPHQSLHHDAAGVALLDEGLKKQVVYVGVNMQIRPLQALFLGKGEEL